MSFVTIVLLRIRTKEFGLIIMNRILQLTLVLLLVASTSGCSNLQTVLTSSTNTKNPLKSIDDIKIERLLTTGTWKYQSQVEDCNDTSWKQRFYPNRYYYSVGSACQVPDAFSVDAESWYIKDQYLYITNLSPKEADDIVLKYSIEYLDKAKLILGSNGYKYTFIK